MLKKQAKKLLDSEREKTGDLEQKLLERTTKLTEKIDTALKELRKAVESRENDKPRPVS